MKTIVLFVALLVPFFSYAEDKVTLFVTLSPAGSFQAVSKKMEGNLYKQGEEFTTENISVSIETFKTGIDLRDEHTWKHLNSNKHPRAILTDLKTKSGKATANLQINGVKRPINITYKVQDNDVVANFSVKASEFQLKKAEYLGVKVDDLIKVEVMLPFKIKK